MTRVSVARCATYERPEIHDALEQALAPLGGISAFVSPGQRVLLKVNLLTRATPEKAVTTHPELVRALVRLVRSAGGHPSVGDSPGGRNTAASARRVFEDSGMAAVCAEEDVPLLLLDDELVRVPAPAGRLYGRFTLGKAVVDADVVVSLPKLKTHGFMQYTGAVKNLFGCIPGLDKAQFHVKVPDREDFAMMLLDLMDAVRPSLTVIDAVVGMEGEGPAGGRPKQIGALLASADMVAADVVASAIVGFDPMDVYTNRVAARIGSGPKSIDDIEIVGVPWPEVAPASFEHPLRDPFARISPTLGRLLRDWTSARPELGDTSACTRCATCEVNCPVDAISMRGRGPTFDQSRCIRCYCCQELCPPQAIRLKPPLMARLFTPGTKRRSNPRRENPPSR